MGYFNPVFRYGLEAFARDAGAAGIDGLLLVDLPPEEAGELHPFLKDAKIDLITLLAPTTGAERCAQLAMAGEGFLYYVSMTGVTGSKQVDAGAIETAVSGLKAQSPVPVAVGFGISTPADAGAVAGIADAVVVGSALVQTQADAGRTVAERRAAAQALTAEIRAALDDQAPPILLMSAGAMRELEGFDAYFPKPVDLHALVATLTRLTGRGTRRSGTRIKRPRFDVEEDVG